MQVHQFGEEDRNYLGHHRGIRKVSGDVAGLGGGVPFGARKLQAVHPGVQVVQLVLLEVARLSRLLLLHF